MLEELFHPSAASAEATCTAARPCVIVALWEGAEMSACTGLPALHVSTRADLCPRRLGDHGATRSRALPCIRCLPQHRRVRVTRQSSGGRQTNPSEQKHTSRHSAPQ